MSLFNDLKGRDCNCTFALPYNDWPIAGSPARVYVLDIEMPMIKLVSFWGGSPVWVSANIIQSIRAS